MDTSTNSKKSADISKLAANMVYEALGTRSQGLTQVEAEERQREQGKNLIEEKAKKSIILVLLSNFIHLMAILLWIGGAVAFFAGMPQLGIAVWLVNVINGIFSPFSSGYKLYRPQLWQLAQPLGDK